MRTATYTAGTSSTPYGFTGETTDPSTGSGGTANGLIYLRARYYNPADTRFISRDTWGGDYNRPLSLNRWMYVEGNPVNLVDPTGHWSCIGTKDCEDWLEKTLVILRQMDSHIVQEFENYDEKLMLSQVLSSNGADLLLKKNCITAPGFIFVMKGIRNYGMITRPRHIDIDIARFASVPPNKTTAALLGHEFFHLLRQSFILNLTVQGELFAAQYEGNLLTANGVNLPSWLRFDGYPNGVLSMDPYYGPDLEVYSIKYPFLPLAPLGVQINFPGRHFPQELDY